MHLSFCFLTASDAVAMEERMRRFAQAGKTAELGELLVIWSASCTNAAPPGNTAVFAHSTFSGDSGTTLALEKYARQVQPLNRALAFAVVNDFADAVELLLRAKASMGVSIARAVAAGSQRSLVALANAGARLSHAIFIGEETTCALELAARCGHAGVARLLLRSKVSCNCSAGRAWVSPLVAAAQHPRSTGVLRVLLDARTEVDARNSRGQTPLGAACLDGDIAGVRLLVRAKADVNENGPSFYTPLHLAALRTRGAVAELSLRLMLTQYAACAPRDRAQMWGLDILPERAPVERANGAPEEGEANGAREEGEWGEGGAGGDKSKGKDKGDKGGTAKGDGMLILKLLLASTADVHARLWNKNTALHMACAFGKTQAVVLLIEAKAGLNTRNLHLCTPLHFAASKARKRTVRWLVNAKCDVRAPDLRGHMPLALAAEAGRVAALDLDLALACGKLARGKLARGKLARGKSVTTAEKTVRNAAAVVRILQSALAEEEGAL